ncbi:hypothetical protein AWC05_23385 [Mycobacterium florentinum]|uniref:Uncharacterized protein n=1 Tax=Mycobacterium florentinum TaxID=292462 RepID=A0A1X1U6H0_MYCFL|nr:hypothetical protein [Mycobacterium florentinum]MCV7409912.1 hypothetical protein [Mycobacterium florentinum]ORV52442.1 hypothetical protein AWC05_23385 [Mycobacterium florentinum]BBX79215.1 hypothetical protein MFLOJ_30020 [Mycobacterium florentinum]
MTDLAVGASHPAGNEPVAWRLPGGGSARTFSARKFARRIAETVIAGCAVVISPRRRERPAQPHYHRRERFVEDAAMSREMFRL